MNLFALLALAGFVAYAGLAIFVLLLAPRSRVHQMLSVFTVSLAWWALAYVFMHSAPDVVFYWRWLRVSAFGWVFAPVLLLHFCALLTHPPTIVRRRWLFWVIYLPVLPFLYRASTANILTRVIEHGPFGWIEVPDYTSPWFLTFTAYYFAYLVSGLGMCYLWGRRASSPQERRQASIVVVTGGASLLGGVAAEVVLPIFVQLPVVSPLFSVLWAGGTAYAIARERFMRITPASAPRIWF